MFRVHEWEVFIQSYRLTITPVKHSTLQKLTAAATVIMILCVCERLTINKVQGFNVNNLFFVVKKKKNLSMDDRNAATG